MEKTCININHSYLGAHLSVDATLMNIHFLPICSRKKLLFITDKSEKKRHKPMASNRCGSVVLHANE